VDLRPNPPRWIFADIHCRGSAARSTAVDLRSDPQPRRKEKRELSTGSGEARRGSSGRGDGTPTLDPDDGARRDRSGTATTSPRTVSYDGAKRDAEDRSSSDELLGMKAGRDRYLVAARLARLDSPLLAASYSIGYGGGNPRDNNPALNLPCRGGGAEGGIQGCRTALRFTSRRRRYFRRVEGDSKSDSSKITENPIHRRCLYIRSVEYGSKSDSSEIALNPIRRRFR